MRSRFFTDTQGFEPAAVPPDQVCVCLRLSRRAYERALHEAAGRRLTSGEYISRLILQGRFSVCDRAALPPSDSPPPYFPPAPPDH